MDILVLVVLVDSGPWLKERLHEQVQEGRHPDLRGHTVSLERNARKRCQVSPHTLNGRSEGMPTHIHPPVLNPAGVPVCAKAEDVMGKDEEKGRKDQHGFVLSDLRETRAFQNNPFNRHGGCPTLLLK